MNRFATRHWMVCGMLLIAALSLPAALQEDARAFQKQMASQILPYWFDTAQDLKNGGYLLADDLKGRGQAKDKQLVSQARMIWGFSHAYLNSYKDRDYLKAASQGYRFLIKHFRDVENGGYYWTTDLEGKPLNTRKIVYGQSFVIYGLVEYYRASKDPNALAHAMDLYKMLQEKAHDSTNTGWTEHFERDWTPLKLRDPNGLVEVAGLKSANTHLHLMEALTELFDATKNLDVKNSLTEAIQINRTRFYPMAPAKSAFHFNPDWTPVTDPRSAGLSYGHNVEFAWLMIRAEKTLGSAPSWSQFHAHLDHALKYGYDHERGGLYSQGSGNDPATNRDKVWWVQAEMLAALTDALVYKSTPEYTTAMTSLIQFINKYQVDPKDGIWLDTVTENGRPKSTGKAHNWKANYHDVRAIQKFIQAFGKP